MEVDISRKDDERNLLLTSVVIKVVAVNSSTAPNSTSAAQVVEIVQVVTRVMNVQAPSLSKTSKANMVRPWSIVEKPTVGATCHAGFRWGFPSPSSRVGRELPVVASCYAPGRVRELLVRFVAGSLLGLGAAGVGAASSGSAAGALRLRESPGLAGPPTVGASRLEGARRLSASVEGVDLVRGAWVPGGFDTG